MDYKELYYQELVKLTPKQQQQVGNATAICEFEGEDFSYAELYEAVKELNEHLVSVKNDK